MCAYVCGFYFFHSEGKNALRTKLLTLEKKEEDTSNDKETIKVLTALLYQKQIAHDEVFFLHSFFWGVGRGGTVLLHPFPPLCFFVFMFFSKKKKKFVRGSLNGIVKDKEDLVQDLQDR